MNRIEYIRKYKIIDVFLVYLVIGFSVIPFFSSKADLLAYITIGLLIFYIIGSPNYNFKIEKYILWLFTLLIFMYIGQLITLGLSSIDFRSIFGTFIRFLFPFLVLRIIGKRFLYIFVQVVFVLTVVGLVFWTFENLIPGFSSTIRNISQSLKLDIEENHSILIYSSEYHMQYGFINNSGFAYEEGAYSIILIIAIIFNLLTNNYRVDKKTTIMILAAITAFSTAGYIALALLIYGFYYTKIKNRVTLFVFSIIFFSLIAYFFIQLDFLEEKMVDQIEVTKDPFATRGRFASATADLLEWQRNPIFGVGKFEETRFKIFRNIKEQHRVNGLAEFLAKFGIVVFIGYMVILYLSLKKINYHYLQNNKFVIFQFLAIIGLAFSQTCLQWSALITLLYLPELVKSSKRPLGQNYYIDNCIIGSIEIISKKKLTNV